jgi:TonB family protein
MKLRYAVLMILAAAAPVRAAAQQPADSVLIEPRLTDESQLRVPTILRSTYHPLLRDAGVGGDVRGSMIVAADSSVTNVRISSSDHEEFGHSARQAIRRLRFAPAIRDGQSVPRTVFFLVRFLPDRDGSFVITEVRAVER